MNTVLIVCDTWRRDHSGAYGNPWIRTPHIDALAAKSAVFENAYLASYPTLPCRRDIATGRIEFPWRGWGGLDQDDVTLAARLAQAGKVSAFITDVYHHWGRDAGNYWRDFSGFELIRGVERDGYRTDADVQFEHRALGYPPHNRRDEPHFRNAQVCRRNEEDWFSPQVFTAAERWLQHNAGHEDFFLMIDSFDPHEPWDPPRYYTNLYDEAAYSGREFPVAPYGPVAENLTAEELRHVQALYAGEITMVDRWLGRFLEQLEIMGLMDSTMVILTSDHGTHNGDHGRTGKNWVLMEEISHIPLIVWHPQLGHGTRPRQLVQPVDFLPTVLEAAGVPIPEGLHGRSILPYLRDPEMRAARQAVVFGEFRFNAYCCDGEYVLSQGVAPDNPPLYSYTPILCKWSSDDWGPYDGRRRLVGPRNAATAAGERTATRLYHLPSDPRQEHNLRQEQPDQLARMQALLAREFRALDVPTELFPRLGLEDA
ncbi:MAG: sulfatase [Lentisphaeria bacterium]|nr:sulfatase [Lentisphaeria bacterium]